MKYILILPFIIPVILIVAVLSIVKAYQHPVPYYSVNILKPACVAPDVGYTYKTCSDLIAQIDGEIITVPKGYVTDLATIPRWYWSIISPARSDLIEAAIIHDYLYGCPGSITRSEADAILYNALILDGSSEYVAKKMYYSVRLFGGRYFNSRLECYPNEDGVSELWTNQN
jgi:hypothetical protein